jgi:hypothetical protein
VSGTLCTVKQAVVAAGVSSGFKMLSLLVVFVCLLL